MKFKVKPKDMVIFSVFCVFLLYFSAIAVLNVLALMNDGVFYGFNPIEAFSSKYIFATLLVFFAVIIGIFFSVSSSIFEHEKGFGFGLSFGEKEEKGYSRWLKEKEMKKAFKVFRVDVKGDEAGAGGVVLINDGKNMWVDDSENHTLVIGATGSGKTTAVVDPLTYSLCKHGESMVFTDPKGEIYKNHAELLKARGYKIIVLNFRSPELGNAWNPLTLPYRLYKDGNVDKAIELVDDVALNILQDKKASDPFWEKSASDYFSGCTLGLLEDAKEEQVNLNAISYMTTVGEEKFGAGSNYIKEYFTLKGESSSAYTFASNTINSPNETKGGILAVFRQKIRLFASREQLSEMLSYSDFNMRDIGKEKTAVFMVIHDEKTTYHALATIFIKQCYETLIDVAQECGGKLPVRTNFILDEFANMPPLKDVTTMVTAARSRQIRFTFIIQNFAQINEVYGKEDAETIRSNCGNLIYILTTELAALEEISKLCGEVKSKKDEKTESKPLVSVSDLQKMKMNEVIIIRTRLHPFKTKLAPAYSIDWGDKEFGKAEFTHREKREIQLFDIKEHVKLRKKSKMMDSLDPKKATPDFTNLMSSGLNNSGDRPTGMPPRIPTFEEFMAARNGGVKPSSMGASPITSAPTPSGPPKAGMPSFDVDDLVKRIDAKIAELEAQEKAEEAAKKGGIPPQTATPNAPEATPPSPTSSPIDAPSTTSASASPLAQEPVSTPDIKANEPITPISTPEPKKEELNISENSFVAKENLVDSQPSGIGFNPFNTPMESPKSESKFFNHDVIQGTDEVVETSPIVAPVIDKKEPTSEVKNDAIETFADLVNQKEPPLPAGKPAIMVENPIDTETKAPVLPDEPMIKPPMGENMASSFNSNPLNPMSNQSVPFVPAEPVNPSVETVASDNMINASESQPKEIPSVDKSTTQSSTNSTPQNSASSINNNVSDDAFFDDFFDD